LISRLLLLVRKDLARRRRAPLSVLLVAAFPLVFSLLIALAFGHAGNQLPKVRLTVDNHDGGSVSRFLLRLFRSGDTSSSFELTELGPEAPPGAGLERVESGQATALLTIPAHFSADFLAGRPTRLELVRNPAQGILPEVAEQTARILAEAFSILGRTFQAPLADLERRGELASLSTAPDGVRNLAAELRRVSGRGRFLFPPAITVSTVTATGAPSVGPASIFAMTLPGVGVFALFMIGDLAMRDLITEKTKGTLRRQLSTPVGGMTLVVAKALYAGALAMLVLGVFVGLIAALAPAGFSFARLAVIAPSLVLAVTGFSATSYGAARDERQAATFSAAAFLAMSFVGGAFIPLESLSPVVRRFSPFSIIYWGNRGLRAAVLGQGQWPDVWACAGVLAGVGVVLLLIGGRLLERRLGSAR
jgi:ABC-type multidrug transport system permease subunit